MNAYIYILTNKRNGTLYTGVTNDLLRRVSEHKEGKIDGFCKKYKLNRLVYFDVCTSIVEAIASEKKSCAGIENGSSN